LRLSVGQLLSFVVSGIIAAVILVISLLIALVLRKRFLIAIALVKESSRFDVFVIAL